MYYKMADRLSALSRKAALSAPAMRIRPVTLFSQLSDHIQEQLCQGIFNLVTFVANFLFFTCQHTRLMETLRYRFERRELSIFVFLEFRNQDLVQMFASLEVFVLLGVHHIAYPNNLKPFNISSRLTYTIVL